MKDRADNLFQLLDDETFRRAFAGVEEGLAEHIELPVGEGSKERDQHLQFPCAFVMTGIGADGHNASGTEQAQRGADCFFR